MSPGLVIVWTIMVGSLWGAGYIIMAFGTRNGKPHRWFLRPWSFLLVAVWLMMTIVTLA